VKQTLFMIVLTAVGVLGLVPFGPIASVAVYYLFAVLRPQYLWEWALPQGVPWSQFVAVGAIVGAAGLAMGLLPLGSDDQPPFRGFSRTHKLYLAFGIWACATYPASIDPETAWPRVLELAKLFLLFGVATFVIRTLRQVWALYLVATLSLCYVAYEINFLYLVNGRLDIYHRGYGGLDNNGAGLMLAMGVPLALFAWEGATRLWRWAFLAVVPFLLHAVLMSYSRGAMVSLLVAAPLVLFRSRRRWQFSVMALALAALVPIMAGNEIRQRFFTVRDYANDASANSRFASWMAAVRIANDYPVFGAGVRGSGALAQRYGADIEGRAIHSTYLQTLADTGYPGALLYATALGSLFFTLAFARRRLRRSSAAEAPLARSMLSGIECAMAVFAVGSLFLSLEIFELPFLLALLGGQLGLFSAAEPLQAPPAAVETGEPATPGEVPA
jgi:probable O-glycosylation ligase (exosortase A-associated)